ncbi:MAG: hypothetical protein IJR87_03195 [Bacteroidaceae bacterium]|nr:hypothetical protein [Bacteroidaceae bacterium]
MKHFISIILLICAFPASGSVTAETDTLLRVLREELAADFAELQLQDVKPYFISFRVQETWTASITSDFGYLGRSQQEHKRWFTPQIRVGSPELDNYKFNNQSNGGANAIPLTDASPDALRAAIWLPMITAYDRVSNAYRNAQNRLRSQADNEDKAPCFSVLGDSLAETYYEPPLAVTSLTTEQQHAWEERLCRISAAFRRHPQFIRGSASLTMENMRKHLVNSEGTSIVQNSTSYRVFIQAEIKLDDGMELPLAQSYYSTSLDALPDEETMIRDAEEIGRRLVALSQAPVADPFTGPALMSGEASGVFFHEIFGHRLEGHRMKSGGQTFRNMIGQQLLPADFQVYCDPTLTHYGAQPLNGGYVYDDEGTRAHRVDNVVNGVLREFLMSRVPLDSFPRSNGHGRAAEGRDAVSRQSNLVVETRQPHTEAELRQMLRDEARRQGKEYGYLFQSVSGGFTFTGEGGSINSFNVTPLEVYRIYVDGRPDQLVRGVDLIGTPLSMFSNIAAGGDTPSTFIGYCGAESGWVPASATAPMVFCTKIETQRRQEKASLMPLLAAPQFSEKSLEGNGKARVEGEKSSGQNGKAPEDIIFHALADEMHRAMDSMRIDGQPAPFLIDYRLQRQRQLNITAKLGELTTFELRPWTQNLEAQVILGNHHRSSLGEAEPSLHGSGIAAAVDYDNLRRQAWLATDARYKQAIASFESKKQTLKKLTLPPDEEALDDLFPARPVISIQKRSPESEDLRVDELARYVRRLSLLANEFPELTESSARLSLKQADIYRLTSEGVRVAQPQGDLITIDFDFHLYRSESGINNSSSHAQQYGTASEALADSTRLIQAIRDYISRRLRALNDSVSEEYYVGPLLIEDKASQMIYDRANGWSYNFTAEHPFTRSDRSVFVKMNHKIIDDKITIRQDPTLSQWDGKPLTGYYTADANGQKPQAVTLVERGIFRGQLCGSTPSLGTSAPTGNLRFNDPFVWNGPMGASTTPGVLRVESSKTVPLNKMRKQLLSNAQREGYDHAYLKRGEFLYRISVKDGSESLIGLRNINPNSQHLRHITALSTEQEAVKGKGAGGACFSIVGPKAMLLNDIELPVSSPVQRSKPVLTFPLHRKP